LLTDAVNITVGVGDGPKYRAPSSLANTSQVAHDKRRNGKDEHTWSPKHTYKRTNFVSTAMISISKATLTTSSLQARVNITEVKQ
jgi:hypothetical protein